MGAQLQEETLTQVRICVIIANYNYGSFLDPCIRSVLLQEYAPLSVIVVDDGSTDNSRAIIDSFGASVRAIYKSNGGQASCWNAGLEQAFDSDAIVFLDADDLLEPSILTDYARAFCEPGTVRCQGYMRVIGEDGCATGERHPHRAPDDLHCKSRMIAYGPGSYFSVATSGNAWRTSYLRAIYPLPETLGRAADVLLFGTAPFFGGIVTLSRFTAQYRVHGTSISHCKRRFDLTSVTRAVDVYDGLCVWIEGISRSQDVEVRVEQWRRRDWRIATLRHLAFRAKRHGRTSDLWTHLGCIRAVRSPVKQAALVLLIFTVRYAPRPVAWQLAKRFIALHAMAG